VATTAFDSSGSHEAPKVPISLHPAFPAIVALWFAALLGLGSMVLPVVLIERAVEVSGIAALVPAASPPLGLMARSLIALASALAGAAIGVVIARRVARAHDAGRPSRVAKLAKGARRPIDVHEELGGEGLVNGFGLPVNRRRALAIAEDDRPSDFLYMAPLPGHDEDPSLAFDEHPAAPRSADEPFELSDTFEDPAGTGEPKAWDRPDTDTDTDTDEDASMTVEQEFQPLAPEPRAEARQEFVPQAEPLPFSAPSLARRAPATETFAAEPEPQPAPAPAIPQAYEPEFDPAFDSAHEVELAASEPQPFRGDWASAPVDELGLVQLVQRLGASLERRREWLATVATAPAPAPALASTAGLDPAPAEEAVEAMAAYFGKPAADASVLVEPEGAVAEPQPAPLELRAKLLGGWPTADDDDDDDADAMPSFTLPLRKAVAPTIAFDEPDEPENDDERDGAAAEVPDDSYSSLLAMRNPFTVKDTGFVRVDEPDAEDEEIQPTVVFPGAGETASAVPAVTPSAPRAFDPPGGFDAASAPRSHAAPAGTDAALRSALATLQRMSGTA
jgi:hypothetical protein